MSARAGADPPRVVRVIPRAGAPARAEGQYPKFIESVTPPKVVAPTKLPEETYFEFQVEKPVAGAAISGQPRYPAELKAARVEGEVQAEFVVDTNGLVVPGSLKVRRSDHALFTEAVREALPRMRFVAAEIGERKVKQVVQQPFQFALSR